MALSGQFNSFGNETFTSAGATCRFPLISTESLMQTRFDLEFGVVRPSVIPLKINMSQVAVEMPIASAAKFLGIPIYISELCLSEITNIKRWKRMNRPDKVRIRRQTVPGCVIFDDPFTNQKRIVCHPDVFNKIENMEGVSYGNEN